jgi:predicted AlkP superfamily pyrophosphatase or phosphodiesterase
MAKSAKTISNDINELMRKNGNESITIKWSQFYEICDRDRLADVIIEKISEELKKNDLHIIYGNNNVIVVRDFCWKPISL